MKATVILTIFFVAVVVLKVIDLLSTSKKIKSVGGRASSESKNIAKMDLSDMESVKAALAEYKGLAD